MQETTGANVFCRLRDGTLVTPPLDGTILPGVTRDTAIRLARADGVTVEERPLPLATIERDGVEVFLTGTGTGIRSVSRVIFGGDREGGRRAVDFPERSLATRLATTLRAVRTGAVRDPHGWVAAI